MKFCLSPITKLLEHVQDLASRASVQADQGDEQLTKTEVGLQMLHGDIMHVCSEMVNHSVNWKSSAQDRRSKIENTDLFLPSSLLVGHGSTTPGPARVELMTAIGF